MRRIPALMLAALMLLPAFCLSAFAENDTTVYNWYCVHVGGHARPRADSRFDFIGRLGGYYIDGHPAAKDPDSRDKVVYLTFDAGYENGNVAKILDTLKEEQVPGAFFVLGNLITQNPELIRRMADEGHLVCNHSYSHKDMTGWTEAQIREELTKLETTCREQTDVEIAPYFRPPEGKFSRSLLEAVNGMGYKTVFWSFAYADWDNSRQPDPEKARAKVLDNVHNGAVILLHPTSAANAAILGDVIRSLKADGWRFGTLDELTDAGTADTSRPAPDARRGG